MPVGRPDRIADSSSRAASRRTFVPPRAWWPVRAPAWLPQDAVTPLRSGTDGRESGLASRLALPAPAVRAFARAGVRCDAVLTTHPGQGGHLADRSRGLYDVVFTLGGDGTAWRSSEPWRAMVGHRSGSWPAGPETSWREPGDPAGCPSGRASAARTGRTSGRPGGPLDVAPARSCVAGSLLLPGSGSTPR